MTVEQAMATLEQACGELADFAERDPEGFQESIRQVYLLSQLLCISRLSF
jgi:hypothetical protein